LRFSSQKSDVAVETLILSSLDLLKLLAPKLVAVANLLMLVAPKQKGKWDLLQTYQNKCVYKVCLL
jgi:hypothetical protein